MLSPLRNRFGIPGVISVIALVFAMFGGAYAASNSSDGDNATASAKKGPPGPRGKQGKPGKPGATGPAGPAGPQGPAGAKGDKGDSGSAGSNGVSAEAVSFTGPKGPIGGVTCTAGGLEVKSASATTLVCNGAKGTNGTPGAPGAQGPPGPEGSPWTLGGTLPPGKTETGAWAFGMTAAGAVPTSQAVHVPISFPIPLAAELSGTAGLIGSQVHYINRAGKEKIFNEESEELEEITSPVCKGSAVNPTADPGNLCIYTGYALGAWMDEFPINIVKAGVDGGFKSEFGPHGASTAGADLALFPVAAGDIGRGTWAVTAPLAGP